MINPILIPTIIYAIVEWTIIDLYWAAKIKYYDLRIAWNHYQRRGQHDEHVVEYWRNEFN